jgi:predicted TIM-barrel fold metal-dependent hydrolase
MIIDAHCHSFPYLGDANGLGSVKEHMQAMQTHFVRHLANHIETKTRRVVKEDTLSDGRGAGLSSLLDVNFHVGKYGRYEWTKDGVDYHMQWISPTMMDMTAPPEWTIAQMDHIGVDKAMLHNSRGYGHLNEYLAYCVAKYPDRLAASAQVREWICDQESEILDLRHAVKDLGLRALHFQVEGFFYNDYRDNLDDQKFTLFWEEVQRLGIPVLWNIRPTAGPRKASYVDQVRRLGVWARRWPQIPSVFTHGIYLTLLTDDRGVVHVPDELWSTLEADNVFLELLLPVMQGGMWDYPFPEGQELVKAFYQRLGASKMHWGSDIPAAERVVTYRQSLEYLRRHCTFISAGDMDSILGGNAARLFGMK